VGSASIGLMIGMYKVWLVGSAVKIEGLGLMIGMIILMIGLKLHQ
jgi:hypothetical protein